tara:strand:- start:49 stop:243 length:195 start_codon:yes stop_codon:yes gene_type:complete
MSKFSSNTEAVWNAFLGAPTCAEVKLASALKAAADVLGEELEFYNESVVSVSDLLAIAAELESQ